MSVQLGQMQLGDTIEVKGPLGSFIWTGPGKASYKGKNRKISEAGLVCGGSGASSLPIYGLHSQHRSDMFMRQVSHPSFRFFVRSSRTPRTKPASGCLMRINPS